MPKELKGRLKERSGWFFIIYFAVVAFGLYLVNKALINSMASATYEIIVIASVLPLGGLFFWFLTKIEEWQKNRLISYRIKNGHWPNGDW